MYHDDKVTALIVKLTRLTAQGKLKWSVQDAPITLIRGSDDHIPLFMVARYKQQRFALYECRYQAFNAETEDSYWTHRLVLALLDPSDRVVWEHFEYSPALRDLYESVRRQVSGINSIIDSLLAEGDEI